MGEVSQGQVGRRNRKELNTKNRSAYREKGLNNVCLDGAERFVFDDDEDLLLFFQVDEITKPGFFGKSVSIEKEKKHRWSAAYLFVS